VGDQSYTFENLLPFFKKSCHFTPPNVEKRNTPDAVPIYDPSVFDNSKGGPVQVSYGNWVDPTVDALSSALRDAGLPVSPTGFSSGYLSGYGGWVTSTISPDDAKRSSSQTSYLNQAIEKTGLMVYTRTQATKILFDELKKAIGVSASTQGLEYTISANKEVVVAAGAFHSPQLLMVSGKSNSPTSW
jgi:choline dehydrogenase